MVNYQDIKKKAQVAANAVLKHYQELSRIPVDPIAIAKRMGVKVLQTDLPDELSGALYKEAGSDPIIFVSREDSLPRQRFACACGLGHYYQRMGEDEYEIVDFRDPNRKKGNSTT